MLCNMAGECDVCVRVGGLCVAIPKGLSGHEELIWEALVLHIDPR